VKPPFCGRFHFIFTPRPWFHGGREIPGAQAPRTAAASIGAAAVHGLPPTRNSRNLPMLSSVTCAVSLVHAMALTGYVRVVFHFAARSQKADPARGVLAL
jgi:hypothetical protein